MKAKTIKRNHYVVFFSDTEQQIVEIEQRKISEIEPPDYAYGFQLFDRMSCTYEEKGKTKEFFGEIENESEIFYTKGTVYTLEELRGEFPRKKAEIKKLEYAKRKTGSGRTIRIGDQFLFFGTRDKIFKPKRAAEAKAG